MLRLISAFTALRGRYFDHVKLIAYEPSLGPRMEIGAFEKMS